MSDFLTRTSVARAAPAASAVESAPSAASPTPSLDRVAELSHDFRLANGRLARRLRQQRGEDELTPGQFSALCTLDVHGPLTLGELSEHERVTPPSMNRTVNALVTAGLARREGSAVDGRKVRLTPSEQGSAVVEQTRERRDAWIAQRVLKLSPEQRQTLAAATLIMREIVDS
ncbi:MarR family winged helix-turn-helix transcriptional regulator [Glaciibacter psychrotolerans]|uniref:DNA-binding MarR family transcriptional regulator n=1 Tax=Glaciibacter psychrotolerans TaxID=670054 RepID=A0A7Z0J6W8_9MICO|nr:MarR family transcriptional regulator [Leifsonia psychrotolerans]NYJ20855.1 DNA-binding MarR family transcriptional regulator [Leifsonia psychrotolerans]